MLCISIAILIALFVLWIQKQPVVEYTSREFVTQSTETHEFSDNVYDDILDESQSYANEYTDMKAWSFKSTDDELPLIDGFSMDCYGNYIISLEDFESNHLPFNQSGFIDYVYYFDEYGSCVNPLPALYQEYIEYFQQGDE